ncbi:MAG TPA: hypothetical protein VLF41_02865 [Candidatus Nanoarchaeia archaeon]|nr:hypothetical protein [Candidatus Nanoarchaeia archaeon]
MKKFFKRFVPLLLLVVVIAAVVEYAHVRQTTKQNIVPAQIKKQLAMPSLVPAEKFESYVLNQDSIKYDDKQKLLSYSLTSPDNSVTVTEQPYPDVLIYEKLKNGIGQYRDIDTQAGKVTLGRPKDGGGVQVAVLNYHDQTLVFAKPQKDLTDDQWKQLFDSLEPIK